MSDHPRPRLVPDQPLPARPYLPGNQEGVSRPDESSPASRLDPEHWQACRDHLLAIDLFNHGYYWEAHEKWEGLWHGLGRQGRHADFIKGLIKLAAAGVKHGQHNPAGVQSHARRAAELFAEDRLLGLDGSELIRMAEEIARLGWPHPAPLLLPDE